MKRMFSKYDGTIVKPEHFDDKVKYICTLLSKISTTKDYVKILQYTSSIENINELKDNTGKNLLMCACDTNNLSLIKYFLKIGININSVDNNNNNILYYVDYTDDNALEILDFLIENGVTVFNRNKNGIDIFIFLHHINKTPVIMVVRIIQYLLNWYGEDYFRNNFMKDPDFIQNIKSVALFDDEFIKIVLQFIDKFAIQNLEKLQTDIEALIVKFSKKNTPILQTNLEKSSIIEILRYRMPSDLTEELISNLIIKEGEDFNKKITRALIICKKLLKILQDKRRDIDMLLKSKESDIAEASLLRETDMEESKKTEDEEKKRIKKEKEKEKKKRKKTEKLEKESVIPRELNLMIDEDKDTLSYSEKMSYILAERKIEELLSELKSLSLIDKLDKRSKNNIERIILRRKRERKERVKFKNNMIIHLDEEDFKEAEKVSREDLERELDKDDDILLILEEIYAHQTRVLGF